MEDSSDESFIEKSREPVSFQRNKKDIASNE